MHTAITTTHHAAGNIRTRTHSSETEFSILFSKKLYLILGYASYKGKRYTYVLLYLPKEDRHYIGVLNDNQSVVVSIWKSGYILPKSIPKLRRCHRRKIRCIVVNATQFRQ